jgi:hypothetical protein
MDEEEYMISEICDLISENYNSGFFKYWIDGDTDFWYIFSQYISDEKKSKCTLNV